jgi:hypothetical protein
MSYFLCSHLITECELICRFSGVQVTWQWAFLHSSVTGQGPWPLRRSFPPYLHVVPEHFHSPQLWRRCGSHCHLAWVICLQFSKQKVASYFEVISENLYSLFSPIHNFDQTAPGFFSEDSQMQTMRTGSLSLSWADCDGVLEQASLRRWKGVLSALCYLSVFCFFFLEI